MNEPATGDIPCDRMLFDGGKVSHASLHNAYATLMAMSTHEGLLRVKPDERPFILSRAGSAGIQRYAANWLGDNMSRWDHLALSLPMTMGLGLSGQPFVGADIGGFGEASGGELLARWYQAAALSPFCRNHNAIGNPDQYPWSFGPEVEEICRKSIELRYRLLPYLYSAFVEASLTGAPVMRPMAWDFPEDRAVRELGDQYLLGPSLLIAPVLEAGGTSRSLTLPLGEWIDWHTGGSYRAGALTVRAPLGSIPIFVRAGSIVPMWPVAPPSTKGYDPETIELRVAVPADDGITTSTLLEDDGESFAFEQGERLTTNFTVSRMGRDLRVAASTEGKTYAGFARRAFKIVLLGSDAQARRLVEASTQGFDELFNLGDTRG